MTKDILRMIGEVEKTIADLERAWNKDTNPMIEHATAHSVFNEVQDLLRERIRELDKEIHSLIPFEFMEGSAQYFRLRNKRGARDELVRLLGEERK